MRGAGFEPAKQYVLGPKPSAFDQAWQSPRKLGEIARGHECIASAIGRCCVASLVFSMLRLGSQVGFGQAFGWQSWVIQLHLFLVWRYSILCAWQLPLLFQDA